MEIDVIVPTYNRSALLKRTVESLLRARVPDGLRVRIVVVDNNSPDDTKDVVMGFGGFVHYLKECRQGSSSARNAGIVSGQSELVGFIDDDEEVGEDWFSVVFREFRDPTLEFIGGPYLANWGAPVPSWLPPGYNAAIGVVKPKDRARMDKGFRGNLMGGNAVLRRHVFAKVGMYSPLLGRSGKGLLSEEDAEFYNRLIEGGVFGLHIPDLLIYHHIPESRLTRTYHRRWVYWRGVSQGYLDRESRQPVAYSFGVPRYIIGRAARGAMKLPKLALRGGEDAASFAAELSLWDLAGFAYGKHVVKMERLYTKGAAG